MEPIVLLAIAGGVLNIILLFKLWSMCNDVAEIKQQFRHCENKIRINMLLDDKHTAAQQIKTKIVNKLVAYADQISLYQCSEEYKNDIFTQMDNNIAILNDAYNDFSLGELPEHLKSRNAFMAYYTKLKKY